MLDDLLIGETAQYRSQEKIDEELVMYSTAEDLDEIERNLHLINKGYPVQKLSVLNNLYKLSRDERANLQIIPTIINSMSLWDIQMQTDCSKAFQNSELIANLSQKNLKLLLIQIVEIFKLTDLSLYERFINEWINVVGVILPQISLQNVNEILSPYMTQLLGMRQDLRSRQVGIQFLTKIVVYHGIESLKVKYPFNKMLQQINYDKSWRLRKNLVNLIQSFCDQHSGMEKFASNYPKSDNPYQIQQKLKVTEEAHNLKIEFEQQFQELFEDLVQDVEFSVKAEAVFFMTQYWFLFDQIQFTDSFQTSVFQLYDESHFNRFSVTLKARLSYIMGPILNFMHEHGILKDSQQESFFCFFKECLIKQSQVKQEKSFEVADQDDTIGGFGVNSAKEYHQTKVADSLKVMQNAVYNLPCFYKIFTERLEKFQIQLKKGQEDFSKNSNLSSGGEGLVKAHMKTVSQDFSTAINKYTKNGSKISSANKLYESGVAPLMQTLSNFKARSPKMNTTNAKNRFLTQNSQPKIQINSSEIQKQENYVNEIEILALQVSQPDNPVELRQTLASGLHELFKIKKQIKSFQILRQILWNLLRDAQLKESGLQRIFAENISQIISHYFTHIDLDLFVRLIIKRQESIETQKMIEADENTRESIFGLYKQSGTFKRNNSQVVHSPTDTANKNRLSNFIPSPKDSSQTKKDLKNQQQPDLESIEKSNIFSVVSLAELPTSKYQEIAYSLLLDQLVLLFDKIIISTGGSRQDCASFLDGIASHVPRFNPIEFHKCFFDKLDALITFSCAMIRQKAFRVLAWMLHVQHREELRQEILLLIRRGSRSALQANMNGLSTIQQRKNFIAFCLESIEVNAPHKDGMFQALFWDKLLRFFTNETNKDVLLFLVKNLANLRRQLAINMGVLFNEAIKNAIQKLKSRQSIMCAKAKKILRGVDHSENVTLSESDMVKYKERTSVCLFDVKFIGRKHQKNLNDREEFEKRIKSENVPNQTDYPNNNEDAQEHNFFDLPNFNMERKISEKVQKLQKLNSNQLASVNNLKMAKSFSDPTSQLNLTNGIPAKRNSQKNPRKLFQSKTVEVEVQKVRPKSPHLMKQDRHLDKKEDSNPQKCVIKYQSSSQIQNYEVQKAQSYQKIDVVNQEKDINKNKLNQKPSLNTHRPFQHLSDKGKEVLILSKSRFQKRPELMNFLENKSNPQSDQSLQNQSQAYNSSPRKQLNQKQTFIVNQIGKKTTQSQILSTYTSSPGKISAQKSKQQRQKFDQQQQNQASKQVTISGQHKCSDKVQSSRKISSSLAKASPILESRARKFAQKKVVHNNEEQKVDKKTDSPFKMTQSDHLNPPINQVKPKRSTTLRLLQAFDNQANLNSIQDQPAISSPSQKSQNSNQIVQFDLQLPLSPEKQSKKQAEISRNLTTALEQKSASFSQIPRQRQFSLKLQKSGGKAKRILTAQDNIVDLACSESNTDHQNNGQSQIQNAKIFNYQTTDSAPVNQKRRKITKKKMIDKQTDFVAMISSPNSTRNLRSTNHNLQDATSVGIKGGNNFAQVLSARQNDYQGVSAKSELGFSSLSKFGKKLSVMSDIQKQNSQRVEQNIFSPPRKLKLLSPKNKSKQILPKVIQIDESQKLLSDKQMPQILEKSHKRQQKKDVLSSSILNQIIARELKRDTDQAAATTALNSQQFTLPTHKYALKSKSSMFSGSKKSKIRTKLLTNNLDNMQKNVSSQDFSNTNEFHHHLRATSFSSRQLGGVGVQVKSELQLKSGQKLQEKQDNIRSSASSAALLHETIDNTRASPKETTPLLSKQRMRNVIPLSARVVQHLQSPIVRRPKNNKITTTPINQLSQQRQRKGKYSETQRILSQMKQENLQRQLQTPSRQNLTEKLEDLQDQHNDNLSPN